MIVVFSLSSPFVDSASACGFFDLILGLFVDCGPDGSMGKLVGKWHLVIWRGDEINQRSGSA